MPHSIRSHLTFANAVSVVALMLATGGVSWAAITLPAQSVGTKQLQRHSVTSKKLADRSVRRRTLSKKVRRQLDQARAPGSPATPDARSIDYFAQASSSPTPTTILDFRGLRFTAACTASGGTTNVNLSALSSSDAVLQDNFNVDNGTDPHTPGPLSSGNVELDLPGGVDTPLGGPGANSPDFARVIAVAVISTQGRAMTINITEFIDGAAGTCRVDGTILAP
jgi:hypothetical protein